MADRVINFNPGPSALPLTVLEAAQRELLDFDGTGMSILEHSHRAKPYGAVHEEVKQLLRTLLNIPESHHVIFMQGGASAQFGLIPLNLLTPSASADYVNTGNWSQKAFSEARIVAEDQGAKVRWAGTGETADGFTRIPTQGELELDDNAAYLHITSNNTLFGTQYKTFPKSKAPLVCDMSSDILSCPINVDDFDLIYAGAQKNAGPAGITILIIRDSLLHGCRTKGLPKIFRYGYVVENDSLQNTIPTFGMYLARGVLRWVRDNGGVAKMAEINAQKAGMLYGAIDARPAFYQNRVEQSVRSLMNPIFRLPTEELDLAFWQEAAAESMVGLKGHRLAGGIRVSLYNAVPLSAVEKLVAFMDDFAKKHGA